MSSTIYANCTILTLDPSRRILTNASLHVTNNRITAISPAPPHPSSTVVDLQGQVLMPGLITTHMHLMQSLLRGVSDDANLQSWLVDAIWPLESAYQGLDGYAAARLSIAEMLKSGTTTFLESLLTEQAGFDDVVRAVVETGIRGCLGKLTKPQNVDRQGRAAIVNGDVRDAQGMGEKMSIENTVSAWKKYDNTADGRVKVWFGAATPRSAEVKEQHLRMARVAKEKGIRMTMHCAEAPADREFFTTAFGETPMEYCVATEMAGKSLVLAHMVNIGPRDFKLLKETGTHVAHCPTSNLKLGSGVLPLTEMEGCSVGLGCDGAPCTNTVDMFREMHMAAVLHKGTTKKANIINAERVLEMATIDGAKALGLDADIGSIEVGKKADFIVLDLESDVHCVPNNNIASQVVYSATGKNVTMVVVDGKVLMKNRVLTTVDEASVVREARRRRIEIVERAGVKLTQRWPIS